MQTFICAKVFLKRFLEAMNGHWKFPSLIKKDYKEHCSRDVMCNNVSFRLESFQIMAEITI